MSLFEVSNSVLDRGLVQADGEKYCLGELGGSRRLA